MDKIPFIRASKPKWPDAETCVGHFRGMKGKYKCWEIKNRDAEPFSVILDRVRSELLQHCSRVPKSSFLGYDLYMIGQSPEQSIPHIMFHCPREHPRKEAMKHVSKSGILDDFQGLAVGQWRSPPHMPQIVLAAGTASGTPELREPLEDILIHLACQIESSPSSRNQNVAGVSSDPQGKHKQLELTIERTFRTSSTPGAVRKATVAITVSFEGRICYLVPAHVLFDEAASLQCEGSDDDAFEFGGFDHQVESETDDLETVQITSLASTSPKSESPELPESCSDQFDSYYGGREESPEMTSAENSAFFLSSATDIPSQQLPNAIDSLGLPLVSPSLDYALIEASPRDGWSDRLLQLTDHVARNIGEDQTPVNLRNIYGRVINGTLSSRPTFMRFPNGSSSELVYPVSLQGHLRPGDCGAAVCDNVTGQLYGHVVAGSFQGSIAFIVSAVSVLRDIKGEKVRETSNDCTEPSKHILKFQLQYIIPLITETGA